MNIYCEKTNQVIRPATQSEINYWNAIQLVDPGIATCGYRFHLPHYEFIYLA